jgi:hypothetical protein
MLTVQRYDAATLSVESFARTPQGGIRARARCTRSGVLPYEMPDGSIRLEWRPPEEVFDPASYQTLWDAPITVQHPDSGEVDASTYREETVGHVCSDVVPEGNEFLSGHVVIQDQSTVRMSLGGHLKEFSPGYTAKLDMTPGVVPAGLPDAGKPYHCIQRFIRYNHLAHLAPGQGRSGPEVAIRLDSRGNQIGPLTPKEPPMTPEQQAALDALTALLPKLQALVAAPAPAAPTPPAAPTLDAPPPAPAPAPAPPEPKKDEAVPTPEEKKNDAKAKAEAAAENERMVNDSLELRDQARTVLGSEYSFKGQTNQQIMTAVVKHVDSAFELGQRGDEYLRGRYEAALSQHADRQHLALRTVHNDSADGKPVTHVDSLQAKISNAWQTK